MLRMCLPLQVARAMICIIICTNVSTSLYFHVVDDITDIRVSDPLWCTESLEPHFYFHCIINTLVFHMK